MEGDILPLSPVCCQVCVSMYLDNGGFSSCGNLNPTWDNCGIPDCTNSHISWPGRWRRLIIHFSPPPCLQGSSTWSLRTAVLKRALKPTKELFWQGDGTLTELLSSLVKKQTNKQNHDEMMLTLTVLFCFLFFFSNITIFISILLQ